MCKLQHSYLDLVICVSMCGYVCVCYISRSCNEDRIVSSRPVNVNVNVNVNGTFTPL
jgi:hypothetical protein